MNYREKTPLGYGEMGCRALMHKYRPEELPPKGAMFYHQGVFLSGMQQIYLIGGNKEYFNYIKEYCDSVIGENGEIYGIDHEVTDYKQEAEWGEIVNMDAMTMLDCKQPVILLYNLYEETKDEKYKKAIETISRSMYFWPVNHYGGYWHMMTQHHQMWMDGAYMAGPLSVMYSHYFGDETLRERAIHQIFLMNDHMLDKKTGLYFHGWDPSGEMAWADSETGLSSQIWGRAVGWYAVAILDVLDYIPKDHPAVERLKQIEKDLLTALKKAQDEKTGMWFNVLDKPNEAGNWVESSCTHLFVYSYAKAIRTGVVPEEEFADVLEKAYKGSIDRLYCDEEGYLVIDDVCIGTCIDEGTYEHYIGRERIKNDLHGAGAFILMCAEMQRYLDSKED